MTRSRRGEPPNPELPEIFPNEGIQLLWSAINDAEALLESRPITSDEYNSWQLVTENYLNMAFGRNSENVGNVMGVGKYRYIASTPGEAQRERDRAEDLETQKSRLTSLVKVLEAKVQRTVNGPNSPTAACPGHKTFVVHGQNDQARLDVTSFLEKLEQETVVLLERPSEGKTIIEKFEKHADEVGYAVVLLTGDDRGGPEGLAYEDQKLRARQNVIFELGYFIGKLGRKRVCTLYSSGVEVPSDYSGVVFVPMDEAGAWKLGLSREMKAAGLPIDLNKAIE